MKETDAPPARPLPVGVTTIITEAARMRKGATRLFLHASRYGGNLNELRRVHVLADLDKAADMIQHARKTLGATEGEME
jgi:hypothetical protein